MKLEQTMRRTAENMARLYSPKPSVRRDLYKCLSDTPEQRKQILLEAAVISLVGVAFSIIIYLLRQL